MRFLIISIGSIVATEETLETRPLGGSETAMLRTARALRAAGHAVQLVQTKPELLALERGFQEPDALLVLRSPHNAQLFATLAPGRTYLWCHDDVDQPVLAVLADPAFRRLVLERVTQFLVLSQYHQQRFKQQFGIPEERLSIVGNGVDLSLFEGAPPRLNRCLYTSNPARGLELMPAIWPLVRARVPDAELEIYSSWQVYRQQDSLKELALYDQLRRLPGVRYCGPRCCSTPTISRRRSASRPWRPVRPAV